MVRGSHKSSLGRAKVVSNSIPNDNDGVKHDSSLGAKNRHQEWSQAWIQSWGGIWNQVSSILDTKDGVKLGSIFSAEIGTKLALSLTPRTELTWFYLQC
jgi:hypothetical protein